MKQQWKRLLSSIMAAILAVGLPVTTAFAEDDPTPVEVNPFVLTAEPASGTMNLTELGDIDWVYVRGNPGSGDGTGNPDPMANAVRKAGVTSVIRVENLSGAEVTRLTDSPVRFTWTGGTPTAGGDAAATGTSARNGGVFNYQSGDAASVGKEITQPAGYKVTIPAANQIRVLTLVSGVWQSKSEVSIGVDGEPPVFFYEQQAGGTANAYQYTLTIRPNVAITMTGRLKEKFHIHGNMSLSGMTLSSVAVPPAPPVFNVGDTAGGTINLTTEGQKDWVYYAGRESDSAPIVHRKNINPELINVTRVIPADIIGEAGAEGSVSYSWSDAKAPSPAAGSGGIRTVMNHNKGSRTIVADNGYVIDVPAAATGQTLFFVFGVWEATVSVTASLNDTLVGTPVTVSTSGAVRKNATLRIPANQTGKIAVTYTAKTNNDGNATLEGITLKEADARTYRQKCTDRVAQAEAMLANGELEASEFALAQLENEIGSTKTVLENVGASDLEVYEAFLLLERAYATATSVNFLGSGKYAYETNPGLVSSFGWEGDLHAPIAFIDGSYRLRSYGNAMVTFGVRDIPGKIKWYNAEGYLPSFISEYSKGDMDYKIQSFADLVTINGDKFEIAYSRMTVKNNGSSSVRLPSVSNVLIPFGTYPTEVGAGATVVRDYAIPADRFGNNYAWPTATEVVAAGGYDTHYTHMKDYWNDRLAPLAEIVQLPDEELINAYKAGFIYQMIIRDDIMAGSVLEPRLHVGENGYDRLFDHDTLGIIATLFTIGDYELAQDYLKTIPESGVEYPDSAWKYSWPYAVYLQRTGDIQFIRDRFNAIKQNTRLIETQRINGGTGIMKITNAVDSDGYWTIDNWSSLLGLTTYRYICLALGETVEAAWAQAQYESLLAAVNAELQATMTNNNLDYIPFHMRMSNTAAGNPRRDARDANWASMFLFGRWGWDGYLFGAEQSGPMLNKIDDTYTFGFNRRASANLIDNPPNENFGGYPHGFFSSAYNAGYGSTALRGEEYRDIGIKAYQFMINEAMSGPFGWWEGVDYPNAGSPWNRNHAAGGGGSNQHMWGQATATKMLFDALIALKYSEDGEGGYNESVIIGRGVPEAWIADGEVIEVEKYPISDGGRIGYELTTVGDTVTIHFTGDTDIEKSVELIAFKNNIKTAGGLTYDYAAGIVTVPADADTVTVTLGQPTAVTATATDLEAADGSVDITLSPGIDNLSASDITVNKDGAALTAGTDYTISSLTGTTTAFTISFDEAAGIDNTSVITVAIVKDGYTVNNGEALAVTVDIEEEPTIVDVTGVTLNRNELYVQIGNTATLTAAVAPSNATNKAVSWLSSDETIATVLDGVITTVATGQALVTVTTEDGGFTDACTVHVTEDEQPTDIPVSGVTLNKDAVSLIAGGSETLTATVAPADATNQTVTWSSGNEGIATVTNGVVTAVSPGRAVITVTTEDGGLTAACAVTVTEPAPEIIPVSGVTLNKSTVRLTAGNTETLTATVTPENATNKTVIWSSSDEDIATVKNGVVKAIKKGTATITVTTVDGIFTADCEVTVRAKSSSSSSSGSSSSSSSQPSSENKNENKTEVITETDTSKVISDAVAKGETPVIELTGESSEVRLSGKTLMENAKAGNDVAFVKGKAQISIVPQALTWIGVRQSSSLVVNVAEKAIDASVAEALNQMASINKELAKTSYDIALTHDDKRVAKAELLFKISIDLSDMELTTAQFKTLTGIYYDGSSDGYKQLGGEVSEDGKTFTFYSSYSGEHSIAVSNALTKIRLRADETAYSVNERTLESDVMPYIQNGRLSLPLRVVAEALGAEVGWDDETKTVTLTADGRTESFIIGRPLPNNMGTPELKDDRTFVPLRYIAEALGANVVWDDTDRTVRIYK